MSIYTEKGFKNREDYLKTLSEDLGINMETVQTLADLFGPEEDFDGLVTSLEDIEDHSVYS